MKGAFLAVCAATVLSEVYAARLLPFTKRTPTTGASFSAQRGTGLVPHRGSSKAVSPTQGSSLSDADDFLYLLNITLGGQIFTCQIDTGSSDLWVIPSKDHPVKTVNTTDVAASVTYADGSGLSGLVDFAELVVGGYTIPSQAFINPNKTVNTTQLVDGNANMNCLIGLSFDLLSRVNNHIMEAYGRNITLGQTPLSNIFDQNPSLPNCLDIHLQRSVDLENTESGLLLIGEHADGFGNITAQPVLNTVTETQWVVEVDAITVAGKNLTFNSSAVPSLSKTKKLGGLLDSGSSALILPDAMIDAIFESVPNSFYSQEGHSWFVDCMSSTNVSITMGGVEYHIHPLDLTQVTQLEVVDHGKKENITVCRGFLDPVGEACGAGCDLIMGDVFLRNVIASFNFGNWTQATTPNDGSFIQLLPLTNQTDEWGDFLATRAANLKSLPRAPPTSELQSLFAQQTDDDSDDSSTTDSSTTDSSTPDSSSTDNSSPQHLATNNGAAKAAMADGITSDDSQLVSLVKEYGPVIIGLLAGNILIGVSLLAVGIAACLRKQGAKSRSISPSYAPVRFKEADRGLDMTY